MSDKTLTPFETLPESAADLPLISVIVPVRNEEAFIAPTLEALLAQDYGDQRFEVIVVDGESTDRTREIVRSYAAQHNCVKLLDNPRRWSSSARNIGVQASSGDIILIVDGHCEIHSRSYMKELQAAFARSGADCIGRPQPLRVSNATTLQRAIAVARESRLGHHPDSYIYSDQEQLVPAHSVAVAYRRSVFERIGLFDESFDACEDVEFNHRIDQADMKCLLAPTVALHYHPRAGLAALFKQLVRYGRGRIRLLRKHRDTFSVKTMAPAVFVLGIALAACTFPVAKELALAYALLVGAYLLIIMLASIVIVVGNRDWRILPWLPLVFITIHVSAGCGMLQEFCSWMSGRGRASTSVNVAQYF